MAPRNDTQVVDESAADAPFPDFEKMSSEAAGQMILSRLGEIDITRENAGVQSFAAVSDTGRWPLVHKKALVGQPFAVLGVQYRPAVGAGGDGSIEFYQVVFAGVAVKLADGTQNVTKQGRTFMCVAGRVGPGLSEDDINSVAGWEMFTIAEEVSIHAPVLCPQGYREVQVPAGEYYTVRPEAPKAFDFFPD